MPGRHRWDPICPPPEGLVRPVRLDPKGGTGPTRGQARGPRWVQTSHGFYVPAEVDRSVPEQRILEQSVRLPPGGAVTGWAGIRLWGANLVDGLEQDGVTRLPVPLCIGRGADIRADEAVQLLRGSLGPGEVVLRFGIPCVSPERAVVDAMRTAPGLVEAVVAMDMAAAGEVTSLRRVRAYLTAHPRLPGARQTGKALGLASEHSRSPNEVRMRMVWSLIASLPAPLVNQPIFDRESGRLLGYPDLLDVEAGVVGEFDGADHRSATRQSKDVDREDRFRRHDLELFRVTGQDLGDEARVADRMLNARARAKWVPPDRRTWTLSPPPWWRSELPLDEQLPFREVKRQREEADWQRKHGESCE